MNVNRSRAAFWTAALAVFATAPGLVSAARAVDPWADAVVSYSPGSGAAAGYTNAAVALGEPERVTGEEYGFPSNVTMFNSPFADDEIVSIGKDGELTVRFDEPVTNDPGHLFGVDLIIFGKLAFIDVNYPHGQINNPALTFGSQTLAVEVSADGVTYFPVSPRANGFFPTQAWLDAAADGSGSASSPSNFLKPVNPALTAADFNGLTYSQALALYAGSGGGTPIDIAPTGLSSVSYVRLSMENDGNPDTQFRGEIDAFAAVPEPGCIALLTIGLTLPRRTRKQR